MASAFRPSGAFVPLVTPFDERDRVDLAALARLAEDVLTCGAKGVVALATTGEPPSLDEPERGAVVATCAEVCARHDAILIVGAGTNDTRTTIARAATRSAGGSYGMCLATATPTSGKSCSSPARTNSPTASAT